MKNKAGLTLIEVLVALVIISIAFTAILVASSQNTRDTQYLENKMMADWVGTYIINQVQAGIINLPESDTLDSNTEMLGQHWFWKAGIESTPVPTIRKIVVTVSSNENGKPLIYLVSYVYKEQKK